MEKRFKTLKEFYPYYLTEHQDFTCRTLHFIGTGLVIVVFITMIFANSWSNWWMLPLLGYGFAWPGHFFFEKNKPATFQYPLFSLTSDFIMFWHILTFQISKKIKESLQSQST